MTLSRFTPSRRCRIQATDRLRQGNTRLHLCLALIIFLTFVIGTVFLAHCVFCTIPWNQIRQESIIKYFLWDVIVASIQVLLAVFLDLPLLFGTAMIFIGAAYDEPRPLSTMFCAFESPRAYVRALGIMLRLLIWPVLMLGAAALVVLTIRANLVTDARIVAVLFFAASLLALSTLMYGANDAVLPLVFRRPECRIRELFRTSHALTKRRRLAQFFFKLSYLARILMGILTLGLSLILHTIPHLSLAYTLFLDADSKQIH